MALIGFKAEKREEFKGYKEGTYLAKIVDISEDVTPKGKPYLQFIFVGDGFGKFNFRMFDTAFGRADLFKIYSALGIDAKRLDIDSDELLDRYLNITISQRMNADGTPYLYNDKPQWDISDFSSADTVDEDDEEDFEDWDA